MFTLSKRRTTKRKRLIKNRKSNVDFFTNTGQLLITGLFIWCRSGTGRIRNKTLETELPEKRYYGISLSSSGGKKKGQGIFLKGRVFLKSRPGSNQRLSRVNAGIRMNFLCQVGVSPQALQVWVTNPSFHLSAYPGNNFFPWIRSCQCNELVRRTMFSFLFFLRIFHPRSSRDVHFE